MHEVRNKDHIVTFSEVGGTITRWQYRGIDLLYPQQAVKRGGKKDVVRGGMHACFPNYGTVDQKFGLPQHGPLRNRKADEVTEDGVVFRGTDLLGPTYDEECEVRIAIALTQASLSYTLWARLIRPASREVFVNAGFHPYFQTPTGNAQAAAWGGKLIRFYQGRHGPMNTNVDRGVDVIIPSIGKIQMVLGGVWNVTQSKKVYYWRDSRRYLCVEPVLGEPKTYGSPDCLRLTDKWFGMPCMLQVTLD